MLRTFILNTLRYAIILAIVSFLCIELSWFSWDLYSAFFMEKGGAWMDLRAVVGFLLSYTFFTPLLVSSFGERHRYWVACVFLLPILFYEISTDAAYILQDSIIALAGFAIGSSARILISKYSAFESWKKYF